MASNLKKIKGLTYSPELNDRVGVAMFLYAKSVDQEGEDTPEKRLAQWAINNPMAADSTMLALVATDTTIVESANVVTKAAASNRSTTTEQTTAVYEPDVVSVEGVPDEAIEAAVAENWSLVAQKHTVPEVTQNEPAVVIPGDVRNPFLGALPDDSPTPPNVEPRLIQAKTD